MIQINNKFKNPNLLLKTHSMEPSKTILTKLDSLIEKSLSDNFNHLDNELLYQCYEALLDKVKEFKKLSEIPIAYLDQVIYLVNHFGIPSLIKLSDFFEH